MDLVKPKYLLMIGIVHIPENRMRENARYQKLVRILEISIL